MKATKTHLSFELTMPNRASWNGKWTGDEKKFFRGRSLDSKDAEILLGGKDKSSFYYNFGDGWGANVLVEKVSAMENRKRLKKSAGFYGYDWMIDEIINHGRILERKTRQAIQ